MHKNIREPERIFRAVGGAALASFAFIGPANPWFLLGLIPMVTGLIGNCPLYTALKVSSRKDDVPPHMRQHYFHKDLYRQRRY